MCSSDLHLFLLCGDSLDASDDDCMPFELVDEPKVQKLPRLAASRDSQSLSTSSPIGNNIPLKQPVVGGHNTSVEQTVWLISRLVSSTML